MRINSLITFFLNTAKNKVQTIKKEKHDMKKLLMTCLMGAFAAMLSAQTSGSGKVSVTTFQFAEKEGQALKLDAYVDSAAWAKDTLHPVLIFSFGGSWEHGTRKDGKDLLETFARQGYLSVGIDYRLGVKQVKEQGVQINASNMAGVYAKAIEKGIEDLFDATAFVLSHASQWGVDTRKVVVCGSSAGAINTLTAEYLICNRHSLATTRLPRDFNYAAAIPFAGGVWLTDTDTLTWLQRPCPILAYHGTRDQLVPYSKQVFGVGGGFGPAYFIPQLKAMKVPYLFHSYTDSDHIIAMIHSSETVHLELQAALCKVVDQRLQLATTVVDEYYELTPTLRDFFDSQDQLGIKWQMPQR